MSALLAAFLVAGGVERIADDFDRGLCLGRCKGWNWPASQQVEGELAVVRGAREGDRIALRARTGPRGARVPKAALIARPAPMAAGTRVTVSFDLMVPQGAPLNSIHLVDLECATCGAGHNPGIRLYLRDGRLRIDRAKIGHRHAWTNPKAPQLVHGRWHRIALAVTVGHGARGAAEVRLDGEVVLEGKGDTAGPGIAAAADRVQIGLTASSNAVPAVAYFDNVGIAIAR